MESGRLTILVFLVLEVSLQDLKMTRNTLPLHHLVTHITEPVVNEECNMLIPAEQLSPVVHALGQGSATTCTRHPFLAADGVMIDYCYTKSVRAASDASGCHYL